MKKIFFLCILILFRTSLDAQDKAVIVFKKNILTISYQGKLIYSGRLSSKSLHYRFQQNQQVINQASYQTISINADNGNLLELNGIINGTDESIACESVAPDKGLQVVRHVVGQSNNLVNNAVYNRREDWLLSFDVAIAKTKITPREKQQYDVEIKGREIIIRFLPHYYQKHRSLEYFNPSQYSVWKKSVAGWCSWFAYFDKITETDIKKTADVISEKLQPFGLNYLQIDDGYQQSPIGLPATWLKANEKFPSGLKSVANYIKSRRLIPAIWTNVSFADSANAFKNKNLFVQNNNAPAFGNWVGYVMDGSNPQTIKELISPVYKGLKEDGWQYFKLDALRHLKANQHGYPPDMYEPGEATEENNYWPGEEAEKRAIKKWEGIVDKMIMGFEAYNRMQQGLYEDELGPYPSLTGDFLDRLNNPTEEEKERFEKSRELEKRDQKIFQEGAELFIKHFQSLWD